MSKTNAKFEDAMKRLEEIVGEMENSDMDLERSLARFEEGIKLVRFLSSKLEEAKKKVEILVKKGGTMAAEPFEPESDEEPAKKSGNRKPDDLFGK